MWSGGGSVFSSTAWRYFTMACTFPGFELLVTIVVTPALVANLAATILVFIPPVPRDEPAVETSAVSDEISVTTPIGRASGWILGLAV